MTHVQIDIPAREIQSFCRRNHIRKLSLFGSVLREDFSPVSDVDVLVEFKEGHVPGLIRLGGMATDLSDMLQGREVELLTPEDLSRHFRDEVLAHAEVLYESA
jgi:predicted nucleotidyltransferase